MAQPKGARAPQAGRRNHDGPSIAGTQKVDLSETAQEITQFIEHFSKSRALQVVESGDVKAIKSYASTLAEKAGSGNETQMMKKFGWYWEPLLHDLIFFEEMRDAVATISGAYESFADFVVSGLEIKCSDPKAQKKVHDLLFNYRVNFYEVVRRSAFEIASIGNTYCAPIYKRTAKDGFFIKNFKPIRATAMRVLRDDDLATEGYVQLLHRPSEFLVAGAPSTPTFWDAADICYGYTFTKNWYAYGAPPFASLPFVVRLKLTMERDIAEILHKHVPRIDVKYTPEQQMTQEKVNSHIKDLKGELSKMTAQQDFVHTPDVEIEYIGPNGKMVDATSTQNHTEEQIFRVLPMTPALLGAALQVNPELAQEQWRMTVIKAANIRRSLNTMYEPVMTRIQQELRLDERPELAFDSLDDQTQKTQAETHELQISNADKMRDSGYVSQDEAARHATRGSSEPRQDSHEDKPTDYYANQPNDEPGATGKVKNKDKGPSDKRGGKTEPRPKGKRHELTDIFEGVFTEALERIREIGPVGLAEAIFAPAEPEDTPSA